MLGFGDCGTNLFFVGECVRVVMLLGLVLWYKVCGYIAVGVVGTEVLLGYLVVTGVPEALVDRNRRVVHLVSRVPGL